jgi:hypothetical protein
VVASLESVVDGDLPTARSVAALALGDEPTFLSLIDAIPVHVLSGDLDQAVRFADTMWTDWRRSSRPRESCVDDALRAWLARDHRASRCTPGGLFWMWCVGLAVA